MAGSLAGATAQTAIYPMEVRNDIHGDGIFYRCFLKKERKKVGFFLFCFLIVGNEDQTYSEEDWPVFWDV